MSVELIKKPVNIYRMIDEQQKEELMETGMIVPDSKPDVMEILAADAEVLVKTREKTGKVMEVGGDLFYQVLYRADNQQQSLEGINVKAPWSVSCNYPAREEDIYTLVKGSVEHTHIDVVNGRKLSAKSVVKLNVKYLMTQNIEAGEAVTGDKIYQKADTREITMLEEVGEKIVNVAENMEITSGKPAMDEIIYSHGNLRDVKINEHFNLNGTLELDCLYRAENDNTVIENIHFDIPISKNLEIETAQYAEMGVNANIKELSLKPEEDLDGLLTRIRCDAEIGVEYTLYARENIHLVKDAYALDYDFELEKQPVNLGVEERQINDNAQVNGTMALQCDGEALEEILNMTVKPRLLSTEKENAGIVVNGCLDVCLLYGTGMQLRVIRGANQELPFEYRIPLPEPEGNYEYDVALSLNESQYEIISDTELEIKAQVEVQAHLSKKQMVDIVTGVKGVKPIEKKENPPLLIYYACEGDNLWNIARRYRVPIQKIMEDNSMTEEKDPQAGQKILLLG